MNYSDIVRVIITSFSMLACGLSISLIWKGRPFLTKYHLSIPLWGLFSLLTGLLSVVLGWKPVIPVITYILILALTLWLINPHGPRMNLTVLGIRILCEIVCTLFLWGYWLLDPSASTGNCLTILYTVGQILNYLGVNLYVLYVLEKQNRKTLLWFMKLLQLCSAVTLTVLAAYCLYMAIRRETIPNEAALLCVISYLLIMSVTMVFVWQKKSYDSLLILLNLEQEAKAHEEYEKILAHDQKELDAARNRCLTAAKSALSSLKDGNSLEASKVMSRLQEDFKREKVLILTPVPALNAILSQKYAQCVQSKIEIHGEYDFSVRGDDMILDLCIILGNLLDNAIRAVRILPEDQRRITLQMRMSKGCLLIRTSNPWDPQKASQIRQSGCGQKILNRMAEHYEGAFQVTANEQGDYEAALLLPIPVVQETGPLRPSGMQIMEEVL